jgi:ribonuclease HII
VKVPDLCLEEAAWADGYQWVAGVDEAGRGAWAGPVAAAAVILPPHDSTLSRRLNGVRDSKTLSAHQREKLFEIIQNEAVAVGVELVDPRVIVDDGIMAATRLAMAKAIQSLAPHPDFLLIDHIRLPQVTLAQRNISKGDTKSLSIAAASIIAKVTRDRMMIQAAESYQEYGFERHKGYGTHAHREALKVHGITPLHRHTWAPFQTLVHQPPAGGRTKQDT